MAPGDIDWTDPDAATRELGERLGRLGPAQLKELNESLLFRIDHMVRRIEYAESRRNTIATLAGGLVAAGIALFALLLDAPSGPVHVALGFLALAVLISAALTLVAWFRQTNPPYGFIRAAARRRPWKWFYRDALGNHEAFTYDWWRRKDSKTNKENPMHAFETQWGMFAERELQLAHLRVDVLQNLQQVYLLHVNEKYKNLFLSQLRTVLLAGIVASAVVFFTALAIAYGLNANSKPLGPASTESPTKSAPNVSQPSTPDSAAKPTGTTTARLPAGSA